MKLSWIVGNVFACILFSSLSVQGNLAEQTLSVLCAEFQKRCQGGSNTDCDNCVRVCGAAKNDAFAQDCSRRFQRDYSNWCAIGALFGSFPARMLSIRDDSSEMGTRTSEIDHLKNEGNFDAGVLNQDIKRNAASREIQPINAEEAAYGGQDISLPTIGRWRPYECSRGTTSCARCCEHEYYWCLHGTSDWDCCNHCAAASMTCSSVTSHVSGRGIHGSFGDSGTNLATAAWLRIQRERFCQNVVNSLTR